MIPFRTAFPSARSVHLDDEIARILQAQGCLRDGGGDEDLVVVAAVVVAVLLLVGHRPDHREGDSADLERAADGRLFAEEVLLHPVAKEDDAAPLLLVPFVQEAPTLFRLDPPHRAEAGPHPGEPRRRLSQRAFQDDTVGVLRTDARDAGDAALDRVRVGVLEADVAPAGEALVGKRGAGSPDQDDAISHSRHRGELLALKTLAEAQENDDAEGAPAEAEEGQRRPQALRLQVAPELDEDDPELHGGTTSSPADCGRAREPSLPRSVRC